MGHIESTQGVDYKKDTLFVLIDQAWQVCAVEGDPDEMGHFELKQQSCGYCHAKGTFVTELVNSNGNTFSCPVCKKNSLTEVNQWMT